jgi:hypothetical protein
MASTTVYIRFIADIACSLPERQILDLLLS